MTYQQDGQTANSSGGDLFLPLVHSGKGETG